MKLSVIIPSRGRQRGLSTVVSGMHFLQSGKHEVTYGVICDEDDPETAKLCAALQAEGVPVAYTNGPRAPSLGGMINRMAELLPGDVYVGINDDVLCLTRNWDDVIAQAVDKTPHGVFWWESDCEQQVLFPIITHRWKEANGGLFTDFFPFWYDDLCLVELWTMTTSQENIILPIRICDRPRTRTHRMRELKFWQKVYNGTRKLRVAKSYEIAEKLGLEKPQAPHHIATLLNLHMKRVNDTWIQHIEDTQGDPSPPDAAYLKKREEAERMLNDIGENKEIPIAA